MRRSALHLAAALVIAVLCLGAAVPVEETDIDRHLEQLRAYEDARRAATDFARLPPSNRVTGPNPIAIEPLPSGGAVGLLRGSDRIVVLDQALVEIDRLPAPASPVGLDVVGDEVYVCGELSDEIAVYERTASGLERRATIAVPGALGLRDVVVGDGWLYAVDELAHRLYAIELETEPGSNEPLGGLAGDANERRAPAAIQRLETPRGPVALELAGRWLIVNALLAHRVCVFPVLDSGELDHERMVSFEHDGPLWSIAARAVDGGVLIAAGGVEDRPLDRSGGFFGHVDSFLFLYRYRPGGSGPGPDTPVLDRLVAINVGEHGVVTPKALLLESVGETGALSADGVSPMRVTVTGYGGLRVAELELWIGADAARVAQVSAYELPPGVSSIGRTGDGALLAANPLLDQWMVIAADGWRARGVSVASSDASSDRSGASSSEAPRSGAASGEELRGGGGGRSASEKLGEVLFFTTLLAPAQSSDGALSRFTCETCHFEGYADGRTHFTGRGAVHATTKPLAGLFNNKPHFSRALDRDLTQMVHNEFRVASAETSHAPWSALELREFAWLAGFLGDEGTVPPEEQRRAFMDFLMSFTHRSNNAALQRREFDALEARGALVFSRLCESCHQARLVTDDPSTRVPFATWETVVLSETGPLTWASGVHAKTGVEPYVHEDGARVPSLRRLARKHPYFTNGSAESLDALLARVRYGASGFLHSTAVADSVDDLQSIARDDRRALRAFLELL